MLRICILPIFGLRALILSSAGKLLDISFQICELSAVMEKGARVSSTGLEAFASRNGQTHCLETISPVAGSVKTHSESFLVQASHRGRLESHLTFR